MIMVAVSSVQVPKATVEAPTAEGSLSSAAPMLAATTNSTKEAGQQDRNHLGDLGGRTHTTQRVQGRHLCRRSALSIFGSKGL